MFFSIVKTVVERCGDPAPLRPIAVVAHVGHDRVRAKLESPTCWIEPPTSRPARSILPARTPVPRRDAARLLQRDLVEQRLHARALEDRELRRAARSVVSSSAKPRSSGLSEVSAPVNWNGITATVFGGPATRAELSLPAPARACACA